MHRIACAGVAPDSLWPVLDGKGTKPPQFDPVPPGKGFANLIKDG